MVWKAIVAYYNQSSIINLIVKLNKLVSEKTLSDSGFLIT
jgi:hypothetical protein